MPTTNVFQSYAQRTPQASQPDVTPPTFSGITGATPNTDGSITAAWGSATDATPPIEFLIYIALGSVSAATLFQATNLVTISPASTTSKKIFTLPDQTTYLVNGQQYTLGVRAKDGVGNIETNTAIQVVTAVASGNLPAVFQSLATQIAATEALLDDDLTMLDSQLTQLSSYLTTLAANLATFASENAAYLSNNTTMSAALVTLQGDLVELQNKIDSLSAISTALAGSGGTAMSVESIETVMTILDPEEVI